MASPTQPKTPATKKPGKAATDAASPTEATPSQFAGMSDEEIIEHFRAAHLAEAIEQFQKEPLAMMPGQPRSYSLTSPDDVHKAAKELAKFIKENKLTTNVQGKDFVNVEAWQYAGSMFGLYAKTESILNVSSAEEMKYQAKVVVHHPDTGREIGCGIICCSNKESGKKFYQEYAIMSMAQTRGVGKAFRNCLAFFIRLAGYEPTPAEEMDYNTNVPATTAAPAAAILPPQNQIAPGQITTPERPAMKVAQDGDAPLPVQYATAAQKEEIVRLLNHPMITRPEKTKMLLNINRLDEERAIQAIAKLRKAIDDRENGVHDWKEKLIAVLEENKDALNMGDVQRFAGIAHNAGTSHTQMRDALYEVNQLVSAAMGEGHN